MQNDSEPCLLQMPSSTKNATKVDLKSVSPKKVKQGLKEQGSDSKTLLTGISPRLMASSNVMMSKRKKVN